jgi:hypothetical protein
LVPASDAARVAEAAWRTGDIMAAGQHCGVALTPHAIVLRRTADRMTAIDQEMSRAIDAGVLKKFNATYRENRLEAKRKGEPFISYSEALRKLRSVIAGSMARGGVIPASFIASVFDERPPRKSGTRGAEGPLRLPGKRNAERRHNRAQGLF